MFVLEDPGRQQTERYRRLKDFRVKSHAATHSQSLKAQEQRRCEAKSNCLKSAGVTTSKTLGWRAKKHATGADPSDVYHVCLWDNPTSKHPCEHKENEKTIPRMSVSPTLRLAPIGETFKEGRSVQFFIEKTATEWTGWCDDYFWRVMVTQASTLHSCIRHGLVSLAAIHEALEIPDQEHSCRQKQWALQQGRQALLDLSQQHTDLSLSSLLISHILVLALTLVLDEVLSFCAMQVLYDLDDQLNQQMIEAPKTVTRSDRFDITNYLHPIVERQKAKHSQLMDMASSLKLAPASSFYLDDKPSIPDTFSTIEDARTALDQLLNWTTYNVKTQNLPPHTVPVESELDMNTWLSALAALQRSRSTSPSSLSSHLSAQKRDTYNIELLRLSARVFFMLIKVMQSDSEMAFDRYNETYREIVTVCRLVISYKKAFGRTTFASALETNLLTIAGNAALRWCRDPLIRRELIDVLHQFKVREAHENGDVWADVADFVRGIEEAGGGTTDSPRTAKDITETARVRLESSRFSLRSDTVAINYLRYPYRTGGVDTETAYLGGHQPGEIVRQQLQCEPDLIVGCGYSSWHKHESTNEYYTVESPKFLFNISRI